MSGRASPLFFLFLAGTSIYSHANTNIRIDGFVSIVGGMTLNEGTVREPFTGRPVDNTTFLADPLARNGRYDEDLSFKPDTVFGLQFKADLGDSLSATAQLTSFGGNEFDASMQWAYITYKTDIGNFVFGRQRLPLFRYSEFLDVGYAYHWIRPPYEVYGLPTSTFEGISYLNNFTLGEWDGSVQAFIGETALQLEFSESRAEDYRGLTVKLENNWLQLRALGMSLKNVVEGSVFEGEQRGDDNPIDSFFSVLSARIQWGDLFIVAEGYEFELDAPLFANAGESIDFVSGSYVSLGYTINSVTPHITFGEQQLDYTADASLGGMSLYTTDQVQGTESTTIGFTWDFHSSAVFKMEYRMGRDTSTDQFLAFRGDLEEVDVLNFGVDIIF